MRDVWVEFDSALASKPELGRQLFDAAVMPKALMLKPGGSHHNTNSVAQAQYRGALAQLFQLEGRTNVR